MEYIHACPMARIARLASAQNPALPVRRRASDVLEEAELAEIERTWPNGLTSRQIVDVFETRGIRFSEATLRKYVQLGLLPRSIRVGRKGKNRGSCGIYPPHVVRRVNTVKRMMSENLTIEEIQRSFARFKDEMGVVEIGLRDLLASFERETKGAALGADRRRELEKELVEAKRTAGELVRRIAGLERKLSKPAEDEAGPAVGGGSDLF